MIFSFKKNFIFISVPKTGTQTIESVLSKYKDTHSSDEINLLYKKEGVQPGRWNKEKHLLPMAKHICADELKYKLGEKYNNYHKVSFVRNPWDRTVSQYFFYKYKLNKRHYENKKMKTYKNFKTFVLKGIEMGRRPWLQQSFFICDKAGDILVNDVYKYENLQEGFNELCNKFYFPKWRLPHKNKTNHKHYTEYYDEETKQIVAEKYAQDIEYFEYKFGE